MKKPLLLIPLLFFTLAFRQNPGPSTNGRAHVVVASGPQIAGTCTVNTATSCTLSSNVTSTSDILVAIISDSIFNTPNPITGVSGCGATWTVDTNVNNTVSAVGLTPTVGACTITFTYAGGGYQYMCAAAVHGSVGGLDAHASVALTSSGAGPSVTATGTADLIVGLFIDAGVGGNGASYTAGTGYALALTGGSYPCAIEDKTATAAGSFAPVITYAPSNTYLMGASVAIKP